MGLRTWIDPQQGFVVHAAHGRLLLEDVLEGLRTLYEELEFDAKNGGIWDLREISENTLGSADLRRIVAFASQRRTARPGRTAFVAPRDVDFGMSRMYQVFSESLPVETRVFRTWEDARRWISEAGTRDAAE